MTSGTLIRWILFPFSLLLFSSFSFFFALSFDGLLLTVSLHTKKSHGTITMGRGREASMTKVKKKETKSREEGRRRAQKMDMEKHKRTQCIRKNMGKIYSRVGNIKKGHNILIITEREIQIKT